jgi:hypothetical protein
LFAWHSVQIHWQIYRGTTFCHKRTDGQSVSPGAPGLFRFTSRRYTTLQGSGPKEVRKLRQEKTELQEKVGQLGQELAGACY